MSAQRYALSACNFISLWTDQSLIWQIFSRRCCFNKNKNNLVMFCVLFSALCWLDDSLSQLHPHRVFGIFFRKSMHWLVFIVVIHRFKLLNSPWVPLCHVIPPFQPEVWSTQRRKKIAPYFFLACVRACACIVHLLLCVWFFDLLISFSLHHSFPLVPVTAKCIQTLFFAKQYFPSD